MMLSAKDALAALAKYIDYVNTASDAAYSREITRDQIASTTVPELRALAKHFEEALAAEVRRPLT
jgi:hypothetical protein